MTAIALMATCPNGHTFAVGVYVDATSSIEVGEGSFTSECDTCDAVVKVPPGVYAVVDGVVKNIATPESR